MPSAVPEMPVTESAAQADAGRVLLVDVREQDEWDAGHAPGALHLPKSSLDPAAIPTDRPVVAVCRSGARSGQVAEVLLAQGVDVVNMAGGMLAWQAAGLPVVRPDGTPGAVS